MAGVNSNKQLETELLLEWLATLPKAYAWKTNVRVGATPLISNGVVLTPAQQKMFEVWNDWADARVDTGAAIWIVEAKIVGIAGAYGQVLDYCNEYPASIDARPFAGRVIQPVVLCAFEKARTAAYFATFGVRTVVFTPAWAGNTLVSKIHHAQAPA